VSADRNWWHFIVAGARWFAGQQLIEFSRGSYGNMSVRAMLWPPFVKIYQDGKVIHFESEEKGFYLSHLDAQALDSLKKRLSSEHYLYKSRFIEMPGDEINVHGGVSTSVILMAIKRSSWLPKFVR